MPNTYSNLQFHIVFSVKERRHLLSKELCNRLYPYMSGIANANEFKIIASGGTDNHVHLLVSLSPKISVSKAVQLIKGGSSKWIHDTFKEQSIFCWQEGYGVFTVSISQIDIVKRYIHNQEEHHKRMSFEEKYVELLKINNIDFDNRFVF